LFLLQGFLAGSSVFEESGLTFDELVELVGIRGVIFGSGEIGPLVYEVGCAGNRQGNEKEDLEGLALWNGRVVRLRNAWALGL
jgi:hypothetical protein